MQNFMECFFSRNHSDTQNWLNSKQCELKGISANKIIRMYVGDFCFIFFTIYSLLSLNGHLYKMDTSVKRTPRVPDVLYYLYLTLYKTDISLRRTHTAGPQVVRLRKS